MTSPAGTTIPPRGGIAGRWRPADALLIAALLVVAALPRLMVLLRAPLFVTPDSLSYYVAGHDLAYGAASTDSFRTAGYPLFLAAVISLLGEDLQGIGLAQHGLGIVVVLLAYRLGSRLGGRLAGSVGGLIVALSGPQLLMEHSLMTEALFTLLVVLASWCFVASAQRGWLLGLLLTGVLVALSYVVRPAALIMLPAFGLSLLLFRQPWSRKLAGVCCLVIGAGLLGGGLVALSRQHGIRGGVTTGGFLFDRISVYGQAFTLPTVETLGAEQDPRREVVRAQLLEMAGKRIWFSVASPSIRSQTGAPPGLVGDVALGIVRATLLPQLDRYADVVVRDTGRILLGKQVDLPEWSNPQRRREWSANPTVAHVLQPPSQVQLRGKQTAEWVFELFQPAQHRALLGLLLLAGVVHGCRQRQYGETLALLLTGLGLVVIGAAMVGPVPRYRYPIDPLLAVLIGLGFTLVVSCISAAIRRFPRWLARDRATAVSAAPSDLVKPADDGAIVSR